MNIYLACKCVTILTEYEYDLLNLTVLAQLYNTVSYILVYSTFILWYNC